MIIGFIGVGKMARALAAGLLQSQLVTAAELIGSSRSAASGEAFRALGSAGLPLRWIADNLAVMAAADLVVLAAKPQQFADLLPPLRAASAGKRIISLAAGLSLETLAGWLDPSARLVRVMPNLPLQIGCGATVYAVGPNVTAADLAQIEPVLTCAGPAWAIDESVMDAAGALSGSGPAYVLHFLEALIRGGTALGLDPELSRALALQTLLGSAQLAARSSLPPLTLAEQVKSRGGTTLAGCAELERDDALNRLIARCLEAARDRSLELGRLSTAASQVSPAS